MVVRGPDLNGSPEKNGLYANDCRDYGLSRTAVILTSLKTDICNRLSVESFTCSMLIHIADQFVL